jgi:hypothetical protein
MTRGVGRRLDVPYKGLRCFEPDDTLLFTGRDADALACARQLAAGRVKLTLLHGAAACGKSSFLRAGLIPLLERHEHAFQFVQQGRPGRVLFVRATADPLPRLAQAIFAFATQDHHLATPAGPSSVSLRKALLDCRDRAELQRLLSKSPQRVADALWELSSPLPRTLVVVIDQAEEVLTQRTAETAPASDRFFEALARFSWTRCDLKMIVSLRTEHHGWFRAELARHEADAAAVTDYRLEELDAAALTRAIERPAAEGRYDFEFERGLPTRMAREIVEARPQGGVMPTMQIVCERLYRKRFPRADRKISAVDYQALGRMADQLDTYLDEELLEVLQDANIPDTALFGEVYRWRSVLATLTTGAGGPIVKALRTRVDLGVAAKQAGCRAETNKVLDLLVKDEYGLLEIVDDTGPSLLSLAHDALCAVLPLEPASIAQRRAEAARLLALVRAIGLGLILSGTAAIGWHTWHARGGAVAALDPTGPALAIAYGLIVLLAPFGVAIFREDRAVALPRPLVLAYLVIMPRAVRRALVANRAVAEWLSKAGALSQRLVEAARRGAEQEAAREADGAKRDPPVRIPTALLDDAAPQAPEEAPVQADPEEEEEARRRRTNG